MSIKMKLGLRLKFGVFISCLMILSTILTGYLLVNKLSVNQIKESEFNLRSLGESADSLMYLNYFNKSINIENGFLTSYGYDYSIKLKEVTKQSFFLYNTDGEFVSKYYSGDIEPDLDKIMSIALSGKIAYYRTGNNLVYYWPLKNSINQVGVLIFIYDITESANFIESVKSGYIFLGIGIAAISIFISYLYFSNHIKKIAVINDKIKRIEAGDFGISDPIGSNDEISVLDEGINNMRLSIENYIKTITNDRIELSCANEKLRFADEKQKLFFNSITHEFKTPLSIIIAHSDLIQMYDDPKMRSTSVDNIKSEASRLHHMIESALELSRIDKYEFIGNNENIDISHLINNILNRMRMKSEKFGIEIISHIDSCVTNVDREMFEHIIINVIDNGIKYNKMDGKVLVKGINSENDYTLSVEDTGLGIPNEHRDRVFEEFYVVDKSRSKKSGGTGLGLSIVKKYIDRLGGEVNIGDSELGGTKVILKLNKSLQS